MKKLILFLTTCLALIWSTNVHATHLMGADLTYTIVGPHQYIVTLNVFRDCNSTVVQPTSYRIFWQSVTCSDTGGFQVNVASGYPTNVTDTCPSQHSTCDGGSVYGVQQWQYVSSVITLPSGCPDVVMSWASGNRNGVITNLNNPLNDALYISAEVNTSLIDNSPQFLNPLTVDLCLGQLNYINQGGYDQNHDSLVYVLDTAQGTIGGGGGGGGAGYPYYPLDLTYTGGYTPSDPITNSYFNFDPSTGQITVIPTNTEYDVVKLVVYEYRNGVLIGHVERDMQVEVNICTDTIPTVSGIGGTNSADTVFTILPCTDSCFTIYSNSVDSSKVLTLTITGQSSFPGATFTISSGIHPSLTFCWAPTRADAGTFTFYVTVKDNNCPQPGENIRGYKVIVPEIYPAGPDQTICQYNTVHAEGTSTQSGMWTIMAGNPATTVIANPTSPTTLITGFTVAGRYNYIWISDTTCVDTMSVFVTAQPNAGPDQTVCQYGVATMAATGSGRWTALSTNPAVTTIADSILATTTITGFTATGTYKYVWTVNGCSDTTEITVVIKPNGGPDQTICSSTGTITMAGTGTGTWTASAGNPSVTVITNPTSPTTTITGLDSTGTYTYYWGSGCEDTVLINVSAEPHGGPDQTICQYNTATMGATGTGTWTALSTNPATTNIINPTADSAVITGFTTAGTYSFVWSIGTACSDTVKVTVTAKPNAGPDQNTCINSTVTMAATGTGTWTSGSNPATTSIATPTSPTTSITGFTTAGLYTFYWTSNGCSDTVLITVDPKPNAGPDQSLCAPGIITTAAAGNGTWTASGSNPGTTIIANLNSGITTISGFTTGGTYNYIWTVNGCTDTMSVLVTPINSAGPDQTICQYNTATTGSVGVGTWSILSTNPSTTIIDSLHKDTTSITGFTVPGVYGYVWSSSICTDTMYVTVTAKPNAGPDETTCQFSTVNMAATGTGVWSALSANPAITNIITPASPTTEITGFAVAGTYSYVWTSNGCTDTANVIVTPKPNAGPDQTICQYTSTTLDAIGNGTWTAAAGNPAIVTFTNNTSATTSVSGFTAPGAYTLIWTVSGCSDSVIINVTAKPNAGPDETTCQFSTVNMAATGTGVWSALSANPAITNIITPASPITEISGFTVAGTYGYVWTSNGCTDTANVIVTAKPNAGPDQTICQYTSTTLDAIGNGTWTAAAGNPAIVTFTNNTSATTSVSGFTAPGAYTLIWTVSGCSDSVIINVTAKPNAGPDETTCQFSTVNMAATGVGTWSALSTNPATTIIVTPTSPTTEITGFTVAGTYSYIWTSNGCADTANVIVTAKPNAGPDQTACQFSTANMAATGIGVWSALSTNPATTIIGTPASPTTEITGFTVAGTYSYIWTSNGCTDTANVIVTPKPNAGPDQIACLYSTATMAATGTGIWTALATNPAPTIITTDSTAAAVISGFTVSGTYSYVWTSNGCTDTANVTVNPKPNAGPDQNFCIPGTATIDASGGPGVWTVLPTNPGTSTIVSPASDTSVVNGITAGGYYSYIWTVNGCTDTTVVAAYPTDPAGPDQTICQYSTVTTGSFGQGTWVPLVSNPTSTTIANVNGDTTVISGFSSIGVYGYIWSVAVQCSDTFFVTVTSKPDAGPDQTTCQFSTAVMAATGAGTWTAMGTNPATTVIVSSTSPATEITGFTVAGTYSYIWSANGCTDTANVIVTPKPNAGSDQTICEFSGTDMTASGNGTWSVAPGNPSVVTFANPNDSITSVSGFTAPGTDTLYWTLNGCSDTVLINVTSKPNAGPDQTICQYSTTVMAATGAGAWTAAAGNSSVVIFANATDSITSVSGFTAAGTDTLYWSLNGCSDTVLINVTPKPNAGSDQTICQYSTTVLAATGSGTWTTANGNSSVIIFANNTSSTTSVSGFAAPGTDTLYWSENGCSDTMLINVTAKPNAGPDQTICQNTTAAMAATGTGTWTTAASNPAVVTFTNSTDPATSVSGFIDSGTYVLYWTQNGCSDTVNVFVSEASTISVNNGAVCIGQNDTLTATVSVPGGTFSWSPGGQTTQSITVSPGATSTFTVTYTIAVCGTYTDSGTVTIYPALTLTTQNDTICNGTQVTLGTTPSTTGGSYLWIPGNFTTPTITVSPTTNTTYTVTYTLAGCPVTSVSDTVDVTTAPTVAINNASVCLGDSATLIATPSQAGGTYTWSPGGQTTQSITVAPTSTATYTVTYGIPLSVCPPTTQTATVTVTPQPTVTVNSATICDGQSATLTAIPTPPGGTFAWSPVSGNTASITESPATTSTYSVTYTIAGCGSATSSGTITVNPDPVVTALATVPITCFDSTNGKVIPAVSPATSTYTYLWSNNETGAIDSNLAPGTYNVVVTDQNGCTATAAAAAVIGAAPAQGIAEILPGDITVLQDSMIQLTTTFNYPTSSITGYSWTPTTGLSCINCSDPIVNTTGATDSVLNYTVTIMYNSGCSANAVNTIHIISGVAIADAFTPNGDGKNDVFTITAVGVNTYHMTIYDRWGQLIFESYDIATGWDGTYKGTPQPSGIYVYFVALTYYNGQSIARTGNVTLLR